MSVTRQPAAASAGVLSLKQRVACVAESSCPIEIAAEMEDEAFSFSFFLANGIRSKNLSVAKIGPTMLKERGSDGARSLRMLEFDAFHLSDAGFCAQCIAAFGAEDVVREFLVTASDAVAVAGSPAVHQLGLDVGTLLVLCAGAPVEAAAVLSQSLPRGNALRGVAPLTLLDTGIRAQTLRELGYHPDKISAQTRCSVADIKKMGF